MYVFVLYILSLNLFWLKSKITDPGKQENTFAKKVVTEFASSCIKKRKTKGKNKNFFVSIENVISVCLNLLFFKDTVYMRNRMIKKFLSLESFALSI